MFGGFFPDLLVCCVLALPQLYGLCVEAATSREFYDHIADEIDIA